MDLKKFIIRIDPKKKPNRFKPYKMTFVGELKDILSEKAFKDMVQELEKHKGRFKIKEKEWLEIRILEVKPS